MFKTLLAFILVSSNAMAMPHASLNQLVQKSDCEQAKVSNGFAELVQQINLVKKAGDTQCVDPRGPITKKGPEIGMTPQEIYQARKTTGHVYCPGTKYGNGGYSSAALIGEGGQLITNVHAFMDPDTHLRREPLSECIFMNQAGDHYVKLDFSKEKTTFNFFTQNTNVEFNKDVAVVRLAEKIPNAHPFAMDVNGPEVQVGEALYMVSAEQDRMAQSVPKVTYQFGQVPLTFNIEPVVQKCAATVVESYPGSPSLVYSDCSSTPGASGSIMMVRLPSGQMAIKAILAKSGPKEADCQPFKKGPTVPDNERSYSFAVGIDSGLDQDLANFDMANDGTHMAAQVAPRGF